MYGFIFYISHVAPLGRLYTLFIVLRGGDRAATRRERRRDAEMTKRARARRGEIRRNMENILLPRRLPI